jgi:hypothetical protein
VAAVAPPPDAVTESVLVAGVVEVVEVTSEIGGAADDGLMAALVVHVAVAPEPMQDQPVPPALEYWIGDGSVIETETVPLVAVAPVFESVSVVVDD